MNVSIITDVRIYKRGEHHYAASAFYKILERYAKAFGKITLITRIIEADMLPKDYSQVDDFCDKFINVHSIMNVIVSSNAEAEKAIKQSNLIIIRLPSLISIFLYKYVQQSQKIYLTEAMGCAWDAFWNHGLLGKLIAPYAFRKMKHIIYNANYATYVTNEFLQKRYPCKNPSIGVSNVNIEEVYSPRPYNDFPKASVSLLTAAAVDVHYKGQQYMIKAIKPLQKRGIQCDYYLAGGGNTTYLKKIAKQYGVSENVHFLGPIAHANLLKKMREIDLYIQPSLQEGLPRSVIEAMSCGCVCLGSNTAGIPELLNAEQVFKRRRVSSIVETIAKTANDSNLGKISKQNVSNATKYLANSLDKKRFQYYELIQHEIKEKSHGQ